MGALGAKMVVEKTQKQRDVAVTWCFDWEKKEKDTVDGSEIRRKHQLRLAVYPSIYQVFYIQTVVFSPDFWTINSQESKGTPPMPPPK